MIAKSTPQRRKRAEERILNIMAQIAEWEACKRTSIFCPYCGRPNKPESKYFCCSMFAKASIAALERLRVEQAKEQVERIAERHANN